MLSLATDIFRARIASRVGGACGVSVWLMPKESPHEIQADDDHLMTSPRLSRRTASPVRVSLSAVRGGDIDGAWWPRAAKMARELPDLIEAVLPTIGEVVDINVNWSANSPVQELSTMAPDIAAKIRGNAPHHRLMFLVGRSAVTKLLVIPVMTAPALALMVLRQAGQRVIPELDCGSKEFEAADRVMCAARAESASWDASRRAAGR